MSVTRADFAALGNSAYQLLPSTSTMTKLGVGAGLLYSGYCFRQYFTVQYPKHNSVMWGLVAVPQGEQWNCVAASGEIRTVSGPKVILALGSKLLKLDLFTASHSEYLWVQEVTGKTSITPGPASLYKDISIHKEVRVKAATNLTEHEALIVYREDDAAEGERKIVRHIIRGPCLHVPKNATEWVHEFSWHGSLSNDPDNARKVKDAARFTKLRVCPAQTYFDIEGVRTYDDALVTVKVMVFYRLESIDTMLKESHDPVADFVNALSSDVIDFVAAKSFEEFKSSTEKLNELSMYKQLVSRSKSIGFHVTKVVFRGYGAPARLQKMHDDAIERRTKLALERETEDQEQQLQDMKLTREEQRNVQKRESEMKESEHRLKLQRTKHEARMREERDAEEARVRQLMDLREKLGISSNEVAQYLMAVTQGPPSKLIQINGKDGGGGFIHLGEPSA